MSDIREFCPLWGEWEAERKIGEGSFGAVWKMRRSVVGGKVYYAAVKHISIPNDENEVRNLVSEGIISDRNSAKHYYNQMLRLITDEIDAMRKLQGYTNIVTYEDHKIIPKSSGIGYDLFLRMELLQPLTERLRQNMTFRDVINLGKDIATAIGVLYDHQMIHRDIKPQNIFVNDRGIYKLGDYGTSRALGTTATAMSRKGTINYMAPEIYKNQKVDIRADIYSLGLVLYRLLNGNRLPFLPSDRAITGKDAEEALARRISGERLEPPKYADRRLSAIVLKACAYDPADRYAKPDEMVRDLEQYRIQSEKQPQGDNRPADSRLDYSSGESAGRHGWKTKKAGRPENKQREAGKQKETGKKVLMAVLISFAMIGLAAAWILLPIPVTLPVVTPTSTVEPTTPMAFEKSAVTPEPSVELTTPILMEEAVETPVREVDETDSILPDEALTYKALQILRVDELELGKVKIVWEGGVSPIDLEISHYFNDNRNNGIPACYKIKDWDSVPKEGSGIVGGIVPGQRYWIRLGDGSGKEAWYDYTAPETNGSDLTVNFTGLNYAREKGGSWGLLTEVSAADIEKTCRSSPAYDANAEQVYMGASLKIRGLSRETEFSFFCAMILPDNGDVIPCTSGTKETVEKNGKHIQYTSVPWNEIFEAYGKIPTGTYTFIIGADQLAPGTRRFTLKSTKPGRKTPENQTPGQDIVVSPDDDSETKRTDGGTETQQTGPSSDQSEEKTTGTEDRSKEIKESIMENKPYDPNLDVNDDGRVNSLDYVQERKKYLPENNNED